MTFPALLSTAASALALLLSLVLFFANATDTSLQGDFQKRQTELQGQQQQFQLQQQQLQQQQQLINTVNQLSQQVVPQVVNDLKAVAAKHRNTKIKNLLIKHGQNPDEPAADESTDKTSDATKGAATPPKAATPAPASKP